MIRVLLVAFVIVAVCVLIHISALVGLAQVLIYRREHIEHHAGFKQQTGILIIIFAAILILHLFETGIWAVLYLAWGLFPDFETSLYFSLTSYTTMGFGDVVLPQRWRLLGGIEGFSGVLLCGLSTAFIFVIITAILQIRRQRIESNEKTK